MIARPRSVLLALCLSLSAAPMIAACAPDPEEEEPDFTEDEFATRLSVDSIRSVRTFNAMSIEGGGFGQAGRLMKFFIDARNPNAKKPYFINGNCKVNGQTPDYAKYPYNFAQRQLCIPERGTEFNDVTYFTDAKRYYAARSRRISSRRASRRSSPCSSIPTT